MTTMPTLSALALWALWASVTMWVVFQMGTPLDGREPDPVRTVASVDLDRVSR